MERILIVDDSRTSRKMLKEVLVEAGYEIAGEAANGEEGVVMFKELKPDVVTMDITMPVMNGLDALSLIKKEDQFAKVVMITAAGQKEKIVRAIKIGAEDFLAKPYEAAQVINTLKRVLGEE